MKIYAINGSPRKGRNTETMLQHFLAGAATAGAETEMVHLYDLDFKGCISCQACQRDDDALYGHCHYKDDISELLYAVPRSAGVAFGSPIYFHDLTAELRAFLERLVYQYMSMEGSGEHNNAPQKLRTAMVYTMNVTEGHVKRSDYGTVWGAMERYIESAFMEKPKRICAYNTCQYKDYGQYRATYWDVEEKLRHREVQFPKDCEAAFTAGRQMALAALAGEES